MRNALVVLFILASAGAAQAAGPSVGDSVWAQWKPNAWYHGKVDKTCEWGLHVQFDDGDQGCFAPCLIVTDKTLAEAQVVPGARVLARWSDSRYYPATVTGKPAGGTVDVFFDDRTPYKASARDMIAW